MEDRSGICSFIDLRNLAQGKGVRKLIPEAIAVFHKYTCLKFVERTNQSIYIKVKNMGNDRCESFVNLRTCCGAQILNLGDSCDSVHVVLHEFTHAIGFLHEHNRPDRDEYIEILWNNVEDSDRYQFTKNTENEVDTQGFKYDLTSIMHYNSRSSNKRNFWGQSKRAIKVKCDEGYEIPWEKTFSPQDVQKINKFYGCQTTEWPPVVLDIPQACKDQFPCVEAQAPHNGDIVGCSSGNNYGSTCTFSCRDQYLLQGPSSRTCGENNLWGQWSGGKPTTTCKYCFDDLDNVCGFTECEAYTTLDCGWMAQESTSTPTDDCSGNIFTKGWYRFSGEAGFAMATTCVPKSHCGTYAPGWMTGSHPTAAEGIVDRRVCFSITKCCEYSSEIRVRNCGSFYIYELTPVHKNLGFCGNRADCTRLTNPVRGWWNCPTGNRHGSVCTLSCLSKFELPWPPESETGTCQAGKWTNNIEQAYCYECDDIDEDC